MQAEVVPGAGSMPRRARHLIPTELPRRGEVMAAFAVLTLLAHLLFAQLTFVLAVVFAGISKVSGWRLWWLTVPAVVGLAWTLATGPRSAAAGFAAGPAQILAYFSGHPLDRLAHPDGAFAGAVGWLPRQFPLALIAATAEAALAGWLDWMHTDEWAVRPPRPGLLAAARATLASRIIRAGAVVTRDGCVLGVAPASGARVVLGWPEVAGGVLVVGTDLRAPAVSSLQVVHAALRRRKPLIAVDLSGTGALGAVLGAACMATGTPLRVLDEPQDGGWLGDGRDGRGLGRVVRERSAVLLTTREPDVAALLCAAILALGEDLRQIGVDGDGLVWLYGYETPAGGPLAGPVASLVAGGSAAGLPVLVTTVSPRAASDLAGLVGVVLVHRIADTATAGVLAARTGTRFAPAGWPPGELTADLWHAAGTGQPGLMGQSGPVGQSGQDGLTQVAAPILHAASMRHAGLTQAGSIQRPAPMQQASSSQQPPAMWQGAAMWQGPGMWQAQSAAPSASDLVPRPAVPARTLLSLGPAQFVLAVSSPRYRLVELGEAVPARLPRGAAL